MRRLLLTTTLLLGLSPLAAQADIQFIDNPGNICNGCETNVFFKASETGNTITGQVGEGLGRPSVIFDTLTGQDLDQKAKGQADIFCSNASGTGCPSAAGGLTDLLTSLEMKAGTLAGQPIAWTDVLINMQSGTGTALVTVTDQNGASFQDTLKKGQNFLGMIATNNEVITDITIQNAFPGTTFGFEEFKQPRVSGTCILQGATCQPVTIPTPEPVTLALLGTGLIGLGLARRRQHG